MIKDFKAFVMRGNVLDLAVAVIIGGAFGKIVSSLVNDVIMPPIGLILGNVDFANLYINLSGTAYATLEEAKKVGAPTINYGVFLNQIADFLIVASVIFLVVRTAGKLQKPQPVAAPAAKDCPFCLSAIPVLATRCAHCTSEIKS